MKRHVMKMKLISTSLLLSLLLPLFVGIQPVSANPSPPPENQQPSTVSPEEMQKAIRILDPYVVRREDGTFKLTVQEPQSLGIRPEVYKNLVHSMEKTNQLVRQGVLTTDEELNVYVAEGMDKEGTASSTTLCEQPKENLAENALNSCPGDNYVTFHWWGVSVYLDHCATNNLIYLLTAGATTSTVVALLAAVLPVEGPLGEIIFGLAAAMLGLNAATYDWADNMYGCGSVTHYSYVGPNSVSPQHCY
jgi:hypothetical protein